MFMRDMAWSTGSFGADWGPFFVGNEGKGLSWGTFLGITGWSMERSSPIEAISMRSPMRHAASCLPHA
jgi:hypothetical protein